MLSLFAIPFFAWFLFRLRLRTEAPKQEPEVTGPVPKTGDEAHTIHQTDNQPNMEDEVPDDKKPSIETESVQPVQTAPQSPNSACYSLSKLLSFNL